MKKALSFITLAAVCALSACGGGAPLGELGEGGPGRNGPAGVERIEGTAEESVIAVGTRPVADTPVEQLPAHKDHKAVVQTPAALKAPLPASPAPVRELFVSPSGNDAASGLQGQPVQSIMKAVSLAQPGDLIHVAAGTYAESVDIGPQAQAGTETAKITLQGEGQPVIVPADAGAVVYIRRPHWVVDGFKIDVKGQRKYAVAFTGDTQGSVLANSELYNGTLGAAVTTYENAHDLVIENNHIHDFSQGNVDSHGVVIQPTSKNITVRNNDIHSVSGDSTQCLGPEGFSTLPPADGVVIEANHFYDTRENAVDIKTCHNVTVRANRMHGFSKASTAGGEVVVVHMSAKNVVVEDNDIYDAGKGIALGGNHDGPVPNNVILRRNKIFGMRKAGGSDGTGIRVENSQGAVIVNNTISDVEGPALMLGHGTGGPTQNLKVMNNVIDAPVAVNLGAQAPGLSIDNNLFRAGAQFARASQAVDFATWKSDGLDAASSDAPGPLVTSDERMAPVVPKVDAGRADDSVKHCGKAPDLGAFESDCG